MKAEYIARALGGRQTGSSWMARCPAHDDRLPSLSIRMSESGKVLVHCFAGCAQHDVIKALLKLGLWDSAEAGPVPLARDPHPEFGKPRGTTTNRNERALAIWRASRSAEGTPVEAYLRSRGLKLPPSSGLRYHAGLKHPAGGIWPAMVALVRQGVCGSPMGVHRTFLMRNGAGKAPLDPAKMMLGQCSGGAVRLAESTSTLMIGEGIETCLAAMEATGTAAWAALSTSGMRALDLPRDISNVIVLADGDQAGEQAAQDAALRWNGEGRRVHIARPPRGLDFNDLLLRTPRINEDAP